MEKVLKVLLGTIGFGLIALFTARSTLAYPINLGITKLYDKQAFGIAFFMLILALPIIACAVVPAIMDSCDFFQRRKKREREKG